MKSLDEVSYVSGQGLETRIRVLGPERRVLGYGQRLGYGLQLGRHDDSTFDGFDEILQAPPDHGEEHVEPLHFLDQHSVHGLRVHDRVLGRGRFHVEVLRQLREHVRRDRYQQIIHRFRVVGAAPRLHYGQE